MQKEKINMDNSKSIFLIFIILFYLFIFRQRGEREKEKERNIDMWENHQLVAFFMHPAGDLVCNPGMCPDWEPNWQSFLFFIFIVIQLQLSAFSPHQSFGS